jgi:hypothetical protein
MGHKGADGLPLSHGLVEQTGMEPSETAMAVLWGRQFQNLDGDQGAGRIPVPADHQLVDWAFYKGLWRMAKHEDQFLRGRSKWLPALTLAYDYDGRLFYQSGQRYFVPDIDDVFDKSPVRWLNGFFLHGESENEPLRHSRMLDRVRMIGVYCFIRWVQREGRIL